jgi:hypothetical protein
VHLSWVADLRGWWDETDFHETRDTGFLLARLEQLWPRVPRTKPLSVGVVLLTWCSPPIISLICSRPTITGVKGCRR